MQEMRLPIQVSVYVARVTDAGWEYLLLRRTAERGGFWQGVTGGAEEGESLADAAKRELLEETGLVSYAIEQINYSYSLPMEDEWRSSYAEGVEEIVEHVFLAFVDREPKLSFEHDEYRWRTFKQALEMLKWPENIEALKHCEDFIKELGREVPAPPTH